MKIPNALSRQELLIYFLVGSILAGSSQKKNPGATSPFDYAFKRLVFLERICHIEKRMTRVNSVEKRRVATHLVEFFIVGLAMGIVEDLLAIHFATDAPITFRTFKVAFWVALPFAVISELLVDQKFFRRTLRSMFPEKKKRR